MDKQFLSFSSIAMFLNCRKKYEFKYVKKIEKISFEIFNVVGNCMHFGIYNLYIKNKKALTDTLGMLYDEKQKLRKSMSLSIEHEEELHKQEFAIMGMLEGYVLHYSEHLKNSTHIANELKLEVSINDDTVLVIKMDDIIKVKKDLFLHELKTSKYLTVDYIRKIKGSLQTSLYFYGYNEMNVKAKHFDGIMYDVIKKPSIKIKKNESSDEFMLRLKAYYLQDPNEVFYMEINKTPEISKDNVFNMVIRVSNDIRECKENDCFYENFTNCYQFGRCSYYELCHNTGDANVMANYREITKHDEKGEQNVITTD